ncbi:hypothetical protein MKW94_028126, partial [Papaver nudicaule]|nr:hypothetical protein [Papaver nudicaule]
DVIKAMEKDGDARGSSVVLIIQAFFVIIITMPLGTSKERKGKGGNLDLLIIP